MRTAILTSALCICDAINPDAIIDSVVPVLAIMWIVFVLMDLTEFLILLKKK